MKILKHFIFPVVILSVLSAKAQSEENKDFVLPKAVLKLSPFHFFNSTFQFGSEIFNQTRSRSFNIDVGVRSSSLTYDDAKGISTEIGFRKYVKPMTLRQRKSRQFYQGIYYNIFIQGSYFEGYSQEYIYNPTTGGAYDRYKITVKSIAPGFYMGLQKTLWEVVLMDAYIGGGVKISEIDRSQQVGYYYDDELFAPGYEGIYPKIGIKIGIGL